MNVLLGICGENPIAGRPAHRWVKIWGQGGTMITRFLAFVQRMLLDIRPGTPNDWYCFGMDNLNSHRSVLVQ